MSRHLRCPCIAKGRNIGKFFVRTGDSAKPRLYCAPSGPGDRIFAGRIRHAGVAELVDAPDSKSGFFGSGGSIPPLGTMSEFDPAQSSLGRAGSDSKRRLLRLSRGEVTSPCNFAQNAARECP